MKKRVTNLVSKPLARTMAQLLTCYPPTISDLLRQLQTIASAEEQNLKTLAAKERVKQGYNALSEAVRYGWAFGVNERQLVIKKPAIFKACRRIRSLIPLAIAAGQAIGQQQAQKITAAHGTPTPGTFTNRHSHATPAS